MSGRAAKPDEPVATASRIKALPAFFVFVLLAAAALALGLPGILVFVGAVAKHAPLVAFKPRVAVGLPLAVAFLALGAMTLSKPTATGRQRKPAAADRSRGVTYKGVCITVAFASILSSVAAVPVAEIVSSIVLAKEGYTRCVLLPGERHAPMRWVLPDGHCP